MWPCTRFSWYLWWQFCGLSLTSLGSAFGSATTPAVCRGVRVGAAGTVSRPDCSWLWPDFREPDASCVAVPTLRSQTDRPARASALRRAPQPPSVLAVERQCQAFGAGAGHEGLRRTEGKCPSFAGELHRPVTLDEAGLVAIEPQPDAAVA